MPKTSIAIRILGPVVIALALAISTAQAQSGGYSLPWSAVGGGYTWSSGSSYTLGGAMGQGNIDQGQAAPGYALQGGFWHEACAPRAVAATIRCSGTQATLTWTPNSANSAYDIHRAERPYHEPAISNKVGSVAGASWIDPTACGDRAANRYYVVRSTCVGAHADAAEVAEFAFTLVPGSP